MMLLIFVSVAMLQTSVRAECSGTPTPCLSKLASNNDATSERMPRKAEAKVDVFKEQARSVMLTKNNFSDGVNAPATITYKKNNLTTEVHNPFLKKLTISVSVEIFFGVMLTLCTLKFCSSSNNTNSQETKVSFAFEDCVCMTSVTLAIFNISADIILVVILILTSGFDSTARTLFGCLLLLFCYNAAVFLFFSKRKFQTSDEHKTVKTIECRKFPFWIVFLSAFSTELLSALTIKMKQQRCMLTTQDRTLLQTLGLVSSLIEDVPKLVFATKLSNEEIYWVIALSTSVLSMLFSLTFRVKSLLFLAGTISGNNRTANKISKKIRIKLKYPRTMKTCRVYPNPLVRIDKKLEAIVYNHSSRNGKLKVDSRSETTIETDNLSEQQKILLTYRRLILQQAYENQQQRNRLELKRELYLRQELEQKLRILQKEMDNLQKRKECYNRDSAEYRRILNVEHRIYEAIKSVDAKINAKNKVINKLKLEHEACTTRYIKPHERRLSRQKAIKKNLVQRT